MSELSSRATPLLRGRPGLGLRAALVCVVLFADKIFLNNFVDFERAQEADGLGRWVREAQHFGLRFVVALAAALALFGAVRSAPQLRAIDLDARQSPLNSRWLLGHVACLASLAAIISWLYPAPGHQPLLDLPMIVALILILALSAGISAGFTMAPREIWARAARALGTSWAYAGIVALFSASVIQLSQQLWTYTAGITFNLVRSVLHPFLPGLEADPVTRILSSSRFAVEVSYICSGLEGMGLILAFITAWLVFFRREYNFPQALLLVPVGLAMIFALNVLRIAALMLIGDAGFPGVAQYGFHSQAGWIAFIAVACALVLFSRQSSWLNRTASSYRSAFDVSLSRTGSVASGSTTVRTSALDTQPAIPYDKTNPTAAYLMPLLGVMGAGMISMAASDGFEYFYALRPFAGLLLLILYWRQIDTRSWHYSWRAPAIGTAVFIVWWLSAKFLSTPVGMPANLASMAIWMRVAWIITRLAGAILIVPLVEELAYRGYLLRRLKDVDFESVPYADVGWIAIAVSAITFGVVHGALWAPGIVAGAAYAALAVRRNTLGEAILAHATTNTLVAIGVLFFGQWQLW